MIGDQFKDIIDAKFSKLPIGEIADVYAEKVEEDTKRGVQPSGQAFAPYAESTKKSGTVNLRDRSRSVEALSNTNTGGNSTELFFSGNAGYGKSSKPAGLVFDYHQYGKGRSGVNLPERRVFIDEEDKNSAPVERTYQQVMEIIAKWVNE